MGIVKNKSLADEAVDLTRLTVKPPGGLKSATAKREYTRIAKELIKLAHVTCLNRNGLVNYCNAFAVADLALEQLGEELVLSGENGGDYINPLLMVWKTALGTMEKEAANLGMTPKSLQTLRSINKKKDKDKAEGMGAFR